MLHHLQTYTSEWAMQHLIKSFMNIKNSIGPTSFLLKMILHGLGRRFAVSRQAAFLRQVAEDSL